MPAGAAAVPRFLVALAFLLVSSLLAPPAHAFGRDTRTLVAGMGYGAAVGTVAGLASYPISKNARTIFIGTAVGLYIGLGIGIYHIIYRDDPGNPLRQSDGESPGLSPMAQGWLERAAGPSDPRAPELALGLPVASF